MRLKFMFALAAAGVAAAFGYYGYQQQCASVHSVRAAQSAVDKLYRNHDHSLPATDLSAKQVHDAATLLSKTQTHALSAKQKAQLKTAASEIRAAQQMLAVTAATKQPVSVAPSYQHAAHSALSAYSRLQADKPVFTQIYQQPVASLHHASAAVDALDQLQKAPQVSKKAIASAKAAVAQVTDGADTAFAAEAAQVVSDAQQKLPAATGTTPAQGESATYSTESSGASAAASASSESSTASVSAAPATVSTATAASASAQSASAP